MSLRTLVAEPSDFPTSIWESKGSPMCSTPSSSAMKRMKRDHSVGADAYEVDMVRMKPAADREGRDVLGIGILVCKEALARRLLDRASIRWCGVSNTCLLVARGLRN